MQMSTKWTVVTFLEYSWPKVVLLLKSTSILSHLLFRTIHQMEVADDIWQAAAEEKDEIVLADLKTKVAVLLRALAPRVLFGVMAKRALKAGEGEKAQ